jgi:hypothetical protein
MTTSTFRSVAAEVQKAMGGKPRTEFSRVASQVQKELAGRVAAEDRDAEWQRVNSYVADVLKDSHVLYAKLARLQGDFSGEELARLSRISEAVLAIGDELSLFSKGFYEGKYDMLQSGFEYGPDGGAPIPKGGGGGQGGGGGGSGLEDLEAGAGGSPAESYDIEVPEEGEEEPEVPEEHEEVPGEQEEQAAE